MENIKKFFTFTPSRSSTLGLDDEEETKPAPENADGKEDKPVRGQDLSTTRKKEEATPKDVKLGWVVDTYLKVDAEKRNEIIEVVTNDKAWQNKAGIKHGEVKF